MQIIQYFTHRTKLQRKTPEKIVLNLQIFQLQKNSSNATYI